VLVGPSTAVTPAPGARSLGNADEEEKAICPSRAGSGSIKPALHPLSS